MFRDPSHQGASPSKSARQTVRVDEPARKGASTGLAYSGVDAYFAHHRHCAQSSLLRMLRTPFSSLLTWLVVAVALALPLGLMLVFTNVTELTDNLKGSSRLTLYMQLSQNEQQALQLSQQIEAREDVEAVQFISREEALEEFKVLSGWGDILTYLDSNPLPSVIVVQPGSGLENAASIEGLVEQLEKLPGVETVQADLQWVKRLHAFFALLGRGTLALAVLFGVAVMLIIGNTIRLSIESRRDEIVVVKLVGGTDSYVRRPFLYTGFWYGFIGAGFAWLLLSLCLWWLAKPVNELAELYYSRFSLTSLSVEAAIALLLAGGLLGSAGAWLAVKRHLDEIEP